MEARDTIQVQPVGYVGGGRAETTKDSWGNNQSPIQLRRDLFHTDATEGLSLQSHMEVVFHFHLQQMEPIERGARHPRDRLDWPRVGILAQRVRMRFNRIGVSICALKSVSELTLRVNGLADVDGTPILDIKPVWSGDFPQAEFREPKWAQQIMKRYG